MTCCTFARIVMIRDVLVVMMVRLLKMEDVTEGDDVFHILSTISNHTIYLFYYAVDGELAALYHDYLVSAFVALVQMDHVFFHSQNHPHELDEFFICFTILGLRSEANTNVFGVYFCDSGLFCIGLGQDLQLEVRSLFDDAAKGGLFFVGVGVVLLIGFMFFHG